MNTDSKHLVGLGLRALVAAFLPTRTAIVPGPNGKVLVRYREFGGARFTLGETLIPPDVPGELEASMEEFLGVDDAMWAMRSAAERAAQSMAELGKALEKARRPGLLERIREAMGGEKRSGEYEARLGDEEKVEGAQDGQELGQDRGGASQGGSEGGAP